MPPSFCLRARVDRTDVPAVLERYGGPVRGVLPRWYSRPRPLFARALRDADRAGARGAGRGCFENGRRSVLPGCTSVSAALDLSLARRPSANVRPPTMGDGDSLAPALSAGGPTRPTARGLTGAGAREAGAEVLAGRCGGHQACLGRLVDVAEC